MGFVEWPAMKARITAEMPNSPYKEYLLQRFKNLD